MSRVKTNEVLRRKATKEEIDYYNDILFKEKNRLYREALSYKHRAAYKWGWNR